MNPGSFQQKKCFIRSHVSHSTAAATLIGTLHYVRLLLTLTEDQLFQLEFMPLVTFHNELPY